jgi:hypothetical protein
MKRLFVSVLFFFGTCAQAQYLYSETYTDCSAEPVPIESDVVIAKVNHKAFLDLVTLSFDKKTKARIAGTLSLQIIVDQEGKACLVSIENKTTVASAKLNLKTTIDRMTIWSKPPQKITVVAVLGFSVSGTYMKRLGINDELGWHELSEQ